MCNNNNNKKKKRLLMEIFQEIVEWYFSQISKRSTIARFATIKRYRYAYPYVYLIFLETQLNIFT